MVGRYQFVLKVLFTFSITEIFLVRECDLFEKSK